MRPVPSLLLLLALAGPAAAQPAQPPAPAWQLGRAKPEKNYDAGAYKVVVTRDGKARAFPRLSQHADLAKLAAAMPDRCDWSEKGKDVLARMYRNDRYGCCVISSLTHGLGFMTASDVGKGVQAADSEIESMYFGWCGGGDNGCYMSAVSELHQKVGILAGGKRYKSRGSASVDHTNKELVKGAIYYGGGVRMGFTVPSGWMGVPNGGTWDVKNATGGSVGGHEVYCYGYTPDGVLLSTWGGWRLMTWAAFTSSRWVDEVYVTLTSDWYGADGMAPNGIDVKGLEAAFAAIAGGDVPNVDPTPVPPGPTPPPPPTPPAPGKGFTGSTVVTKTYTQQYKDGQEIGPLVEAKRFDVLPAGAASDAAVEAELRGRVSPKVLLDVLELLAALRAGDQAAVRAALWKLIADLALGEPAVPVPQQMPAARAEPRSTTGAP